MSLSPEDRLRYARQLSLAEVDEDGQERLLRSRFRCDPRADPTAQAIAADYLKRAGLQESDSAELLAVATPDAVDRIAYDPALREAAATVAGAFAAVEHLKQALGLGPARPYPRTAGFRQPRSPRVPSER